PPVPRARPYPTLFRSVGVRPRRARRGAARVPRVDEEWVQRRRELWIAGAATVIDNLSIGAGAVSLSAVDEPRLVVRRGCKAKHQDRKSTRLNSSHVAS